LLLLAAASLCPDAAGDELSELHLVDANAVADDGFGSADVFVQLGGKGVAIDGDVAVVGAPHDDIGANQDQGSATVFRWTGAAWVEEAELVVAGGAEFDRFGDSVAVDGDVVVVGAPHGGYDAGPPSVLPGYVVVYRHDGSAWVAEQTLHPTTLDPTPMFGTSLAVQDDVIAVGAAGGSGSIQGFVAVFRHGVGGWVEEASLSNSIASLPTENERFGTSVDIEGGVLAVGSPIVHLDAVTVAVGGVTVYRWDGAAWAFEQEMTSQLPGKAELLGDSISLDGNILVAGAGALYGITPGSATVWRWDGAVWQEEQRLEAGNGGVNDKFGKSVSVDDGRILVGAPGLLHASLFTWNGSAWVDSLVVQPSDVHLSDDLGESVALSATRALVSSPGKKDGFAAYLFDLAPDAWTDGGCALPGQFGEPVLTGRGPLTAGSMNELDLSNAAANALAGLFVSSASTPVPFKGGTLKAFPFYGPVLFATSASGTIAIPFVMPGGVPPVTELWVQWAIQDPVAVAGTALSNAIKGSQP
jgi:hypothetical protein